MDIRRVCDSMRKTAFDYSSFFGSSQAPATAPSSNAWTIRNKAWQSSNWDKMFSWLRPSNVAKPVDTAPAAPAPAPKPVQQPIRPVQPIHRPGWR